MKPLMAFTSAAIGRLRPLQLRRKEMSYHSLQLRVYLTLAATQKRHARGTKRGQRATPPPLPRAFSRGGWLIERTVIMANITLYNQDCTSAMQQIEAESVDLIVTDPPYNLKKMRENFFGSAGWDDMEFDEWAESMDAFFEESARVIKKGGTMIVFMATIIKVETIIRLAEKHDFYYKTTGIWHKTNPMPRNMNLHFVNSTEAWIYFTYKKRMGVFNNGGVGLHNFVETAVTPSGERKYGNYPTQKPESLIQHFVEILSNPNECVLDPFMGSGTTGVVSKRTDRNFIGIELDEEYFKIAQKRIREA